MSALELEGVHKRYWRGSSPILALDGVSFSLEAGEFMAVWGGRRSGKTTLLRVAAGIERPDAGSVRVTGIDVGRASRRQAREVLGQIGCVWRSMALPRGLSVIDRVALPLLSHVDPAPARQRAADALRMVGIQDLAGATWDQLSDGDRARIRIAQALVRRPQLLLADEPVSFLNMLEAEEVLGILRSVAEEWGTAILMTAGDAEDMLQSFRLASIDGGRLIEPRNRKRGHLIAFPEGRRKDGRGA